MFDKNSNPLRPEAVASGKPPDLQSCFRAAGLPHTVTVSPTLAARCGWVDPSPPGVDRYEVAWLVRLVLNGHWPHRQRKTEHGQVLLLDFPTLVNGQEVVNLQLGIVVGQDQKLHLVDPNELDQTAPKRAFVLAAEDDPEGGLRIAQERQRGVFLIFFLVLHSKKIIAKIRGLGEVIFPFYAAAILSMRG